MPTHQGDILHARSLISSSSMRSLAMHIRPATLEDYLALCELDTVALLHGERRDEIAEWLKEEARHLVEIDD